MRTIGWLALAGAMLGFQGARGAGPELRVGAAAVNLEADDGMVIGGGIGPGKATGQEGELRAVAVVLEKPGAGKAAIVACDVLMINRDLLDPVVAEIERECGILAEAVLINTTHTHHAPTTCTVHGYERDPVFCERVQRGIVAAVKLACERLEGAGPAEFRFRLGHESSVGQNSRLLLADETIFWVGRRDDAVRPTGPFDPELPVLAFVEPEGKKPRAVVFNHSTHTIGALKPGVRSPSFYGLAAQGLEGAHGGIFCFLEGASGSTHNLDLKCDEMVLRITTAVNEALGKAEPMEVDRIAAIKRPFPYRVRTFDEEAEEKAVVGYCSARVPDHVEEIARVFRDMRKELAPLQGQERTSWVQVLRVGDVAIVGVPAEFFTVLGQEIKRRSPYRYTYVAELANDWIGYLPDRRGHELGGYQTWTGLHSFAEPGTGEAVVEQAVAMLHELKGGSGSAGE